MNSKQVYLLSSVSSLVALYRSVVFLGLLKNSNCVDYFDDSERLYRIDLRNPFFLAWKFCLFSQRSNSVN